MKKSTIALTTLVALLVCCGASAADPAPEQPEPAPEADPKLEKARVYFKQGVKLVGETRWPNALSAFERSAALRPHATTTFNIGACERAMGRYTRAREEFKAALRRNASHPGELAPSLAVEAKGLIGEIDKLLARVELKLEPASAALAVDGRPLHTMTRGSRRVYVGGLEEPGRGRALGKGTISIELDPGAHVLTLSRKGFTDAVINRSFAPGSVTKLELELERLPATLSISSNVSGAIVRVDRTDFGPAPVSVLRPAGSYSVLVSKDGYEPYEAQVSVKAGEQSALRARLVEEKTPITKRWWFWAGAAVVVAGGVIATYALTRPEPEAPPYNGGSTGWVVRPAAVF